MLKHYKRRAPRYVVKFARELRLNMTPAEERLWERLSKKQLNGMRFRKQHPVGTYIADFYCHDKKLIIELDGEIHRQRKTYDGNRDLTLKLHGYKVVRFKNHEVINNVEKVLETIKRAS